VYTRQSGIYPIIIWTSLNGPSHVEPIRLLKEEDGYSLLIQQDQDKESMPTKVFEDIEDTPHTRLFAEQRKQQLKEANLD